MTDIKFDGLKIAIRNFVNANTYEHFKDIVAERDVSNEELAEFAEQLTEDIIAQIPTFPRAAIRRFVVDYFLSEFGAAKLGAKVNVNFNKHEVREDAWKKYARRRKKSA